VKSPPTIIDLYPPITAACIVGGLWFYVAWRLYKRDTIGHESYQQILWLLVMPASCLAFLYSQGKEPITSWFGVFMTALMGLGMAAGWFYGLKMALFTPNLKTFAKWYIRSGVVIMAWAFLGFPFI